MSRRLLLSFMAITIVTVAPLAADGPRHCSPFSVDVRCAPSIGSVWRVDFGAPRFAPPAPERSTSPGRAAPPRSHRAQGDLIHAPTWSAPGLGAPIDCAMIKPGDPTLDPKIIRTPPAHVTHSGRIVHVAPCPNPKK
jgi:hypothetical protein